MERPPPQPQGSPYRSPQSTLKASWSTLLADLTRFSSRRFSQQCICFQIAVWANGGMFATLAIFPFALAPLTYLWDQAWRNTWQNDPRHHKGCTKNPCEQRQCLPPLRRHGQCRRNCHSLRCRCRRRRVERVLCLHEGHYPLTILSFVILRCSNLSGGWMKRVLKVSCHHVE